MTWRCWAGIGATVLLMIHLGFIGLWWRECGRSVLRHPSGDGRRHVGYPSGSRRPQDLSPPPSGPAPGARR